MQIKIAVHKNHSETLIKLLSQYQLDYQVDKPTQNWEVFIITPTSTAQAAELGASCGRQGLTILFLTPNQTTV